MIEVNLLPGGKKRAARGKRASISFPSIGGLPTDRWVLGAALAVVVAVAAAAWLFLQVGGQREEAELAVARAVQDSVRYADLIEETNRLMARRDSIIERVAIIQEIDQGRYVWPHVLDEVSRALPDYTWLLRVQYISSGREPRIRLLGQAGNLTAVAVFMDQLQASPFFRTVESHGSTRAQQGAQLVHNFELELVYQQPPLDFLETVPLFGAPPADVDGGADAPGL